MSTLPPLLVQSVEEDLTLPADQGGGFFLAEFDQLLNHGRYILLRKLGSGRHSSTWIAYDCQNTSTFSYVAIKVLSVAATALNDAGTSYELELWSRVHPDADYSHLLKNYFFEQGPRGVHLCLVSHIFSSDLFAFRKCFARGILPRVSTKAFVMGALQDLDYIHQLGIIHADVKATNLLIPGGFISNQEINDILERTPIEIYGDIMVCGRRYPVWKSQPLPCSLTTDPDKLDERVTVRLIDFSSAVPADHIPSDRPYYPLELRAPELILGAGLCFGSDIWAIGCLMFELLTGQWLFNVDQALDPHTQELDMLYQIMAVTEDNFVSGLGSKLKEKATLWGEFFDADGNLKYTRARRQRTLEDMLIASGLEPKHAKWGARFIRDCTKLDPSARPSAHDLAERHHFLFEAYVPGLRYPDE